VGVGGGGGGGGGGAGGPPPPAGLVHYALYEPGGVL
jgi:hypothetical protein